MSRSKDACDTCPACGAVTVKSGSGATHRYMLSSPGCWAAYGEVLAREYGDPAYMAVHALSVDAYALQHPGIDVPQSRSSVNVHLASLLAHFEYGAKLNQLPTIKQAVVAQKSRFEWLLPPETPGALNVTDLLRVNTAEEHGALVHAWARAVFMSWREHHDAVRALVQVGQHGTAGGRRAGQARSAPE